ncbi:MAG: site-specific integrase [Bacteroidales bacterium]|nr:site-specific integrase [Bacteroidales bacterium]
MANFRFELNSKPSRNKRHTILLCVSVGGKRKRISTPISVEKPSQFNYKCKGDNWIRASVPESAKWNSQLHDILEEAKDKYLELADTNQASSDNVVSKLKEKAHSVSFLEFARKRADEILNAGGVRNWKKYNGTLNKLESFLKKTGKSDLLFSELSTEFLTKFDSFLHTLRNERDNNKLLHVNTIEVVFNILKTLVKRSIDLGYLDVSHNPFLTFKYKGVKTEKEKLTLEELKSLLALELEDGSLLWHCRNYFFFSLYCAGIRAGDLIQLRWKNVVFEKEEWRLQYQMGKNHKLRDLVLVNPAMDILKYYGFGNKPVENYIFPLLDATKPYCYALTQSEVDTMPVELKKQLYTDISAKNALINKYLNKLASMAGINKKLSMHIARHSFASVAMHEGTSNTIIKNLLAHSSLAITEKYMGNFNTATTDEALKKMFNKEASEPTIEEKKKQLASMLASLDEDAVNKLLATLKTN